jgi:hypothetical protein
MIPTLSKPLKVSKDPVGLTRPFLCALNGKIVLGACKVKSGKKIYFLYTEIAGLGVSRCDN